jgi:hypothetical protein
MSDDGPPATWPAEPPPARPTWLAEIGAAAVTGGLIAALGIPLGLLWGHLAPRVTAVSSSSGALYSDANQPERVFGAEAWYVLGTGALGLLFGIATWVIWRRYRGPLMLLGLALGTLGSSFLIYRFGRAVGRGTAKRLSQPADRSVAFKLPVDLRIQSHGLWHGFLPYTSGVLLIMGTIATLVYLVLAGFSAHPSLRKPASVVPPWYQPVPFLAGDNAGDSASSGAGAEADADGEAAGDRVGAGDPPVSSDLAAPPPARPAVRAPHAPDPAAPPRD